MLEAFRDASKSGADIKIVYDHRIPNKRKKALADGSAKDRDKTVGEHSDEAIKKVGIRKLMIPRESDPNSISHNKFIVLLKDSVPNQVWTGSTNFTEGGILGQLNVGHIIRDKKLAQKYYEYWLKISTDPLKNDFRNFNMTHTPAPQGPPPADCLFPLLSPRPTKEEPYLIDWYGERLDRATNTVNFTAAFGVNNEFVEIFKKPKPYLRYLILDNSGSRQSSVEKTKAVIKNKGNRVAVGALFKGGPDDNNINGRGQHDGRHLHRWVKERLTGMNSHVRYVHTKYLILDTLTNDPILISGSANFSKNSTVNNDENMVISRGNLRLTDMFLGEFMRLWNHVYARSVAARQSAKKGSKKHDPCYLEPNDSWTIPYYKKGAPRFKERELFRGKENVGHGITFFDIDETIFHTFAKVYVKKGGKVLRKLDNQKFNSYKLKRGEAFDFTEFRDAAIFSKSSKIIRPTAAGKRPARAFSTTGSATT